MEQPVKVEPSRAPRLEARQSTPELVRSIATDTSALLKQEIELARQELKEAGIARLKGGVFMAAAGAAVLLMLAFLALAAAVALDAILPGWASRLIVAGGLLALAGLAAGLGLRRMKRPSLAPEEAKRTVKEDLAWAKQQLKR
jgi:Putative Actinobacterial Holin-X, holin superfamily III